MNKYILDKIKDRAKMLPANMREELICEAYALSKLGIESDEDYRDAFYISIHSKDIAEEMVGRPLNTLEMAKISATLMHDRSKFPINTIFGFYNSIAGALNVIEIPIKKIAYPQDSAGQYFPPPFNRTKWTRSMHDVYRRVQHVGRSEALIK